MMKTEDIISQLKTSIKKLSSLDELEKLQTEYLGRNGKVNELLQKIKDIPAQERKEYGQKVNEMKQEITSLLKATQDELIEQKETTDKVDVTLPGIKYPQGSLHLLTKTIEEISNIFEKIGFIRMSYPEVEWEYFSFDALNMPPEHPARDDFETFFIEHEPHKEYGKMVLTPHTSSGQNREMKRLGKPPIRMINIAKTYRPNWDASHAPMFHQFEGLCVDKGINITHLKGTIDYFAKEFFGENRETRLRPFHFQFTEPSFEVDITCDICNGSGFIDVIPSETRNPVITQRDPSAAPQDDYKTKCKLCKQGWLELGGSGMVHPNVLKAGGIDPNEYTGWAFGIGIERVFMMKEGLNIDDIRIIYSGDIEFLEQF